MKYIAGARSHIRVAGEPVPLFLGILGLSRCLHFVFVFFFFLPHISLWLFPCGSLSSNPKTEQKMASPDREKWLDVFDTPYSNGANTAANGLFLGLICLSLVACVAITWRKQRFIPFSFVLCVAYVFEIITYALRFQGWDFTTYSVQFGLSTIAPVFVTIAYALLLALTQA